MQKSSSSITKVLSIWKGENNLAFFCSEVARLLAGSNCKLCHRCHTHAAHVTWAETNSSTEKTMRVIERGNDGGFYFLRGRCHVNSLISSWQRTRQMVTGRSIDNSLVVRMRSGQAFASNFDLINLALRLPMSWLRDVPLFHKINGQSVDQGKGNAMDGGYAFLIVFISIRLEPTRDVAVCLLRVSTILSQSGHVFMLVRFVVWFFYEVMICILGIWLL
jgi:hypothetical protein